MFVAQVKVNPTTPTFKTTIVAMVKHELFCLNTGFQILGKSTLTAKIGCTDLQKGATGATCG